MQSSISRRTFTRDDPSSLRPISIQINYNEDAESFRKFVSEFGGPKEGFEMPTSIEGEDMEDLKGYEMPKYLRLLQEVANLERTEVTIELDDLLNWDETMDSLVLRVSKNTHHYLGLFSAVLDELMPVATIDTDMNQMDVIDVIVSHRRARMEASKVNENAAPTSDEGKVKNGIPASLMRRYQLNFKPATKFRKIHAVREIKASDVGGLVSIKGIVTKVTEVKPLLTVGTYICEKCGWEVYQEITTQAYTPLPECPTEECRRMSSKGQLVLQTRGSRFVRYQEARIQEMTEQVPMGHIPRSMAVVFTGESTRCANPGDQVILSGIYMPKPYTGLKAIKAGLLTDTYVLAQHVEQLKPKYNAAAQSLQNDPLVLMKIEELGADPEVFEKLARSIAPEIYGHVDIKKALLLLMIGGVTKEMEDGMRIRGDLNVCLMGDPGVAKSQLLKYITKIAPRAVYTTGKGSSGVGLTASVTKDSVTNEMVLEGGALVLADNGICCIDEFDKMDESDRTAIHEVMEQQTISISKAGITTTLNARTSILAAANPLHGRYNPKKSPRENINLPPALLSRFDLLFLVLDGADIDEDTRLAEHVCQVHRTLQAPINSSVEIIPSEIIRQYIATAKQYIPIIPQELVDYVVGAYVGLRINDLAHKDTTYTTPRTLLAILRLSQALARLHFRSIVSQSDLDEAMRLMDVSRSSVDIHLDNSKSKQSTDPTTRILNIVKELARGCEEKDGVREVKMDLVREKVRSAGLGDQQLEQCLVAMDQCNIWTLNSEGTSLKLFN